MLELARQAVATQAWRTACDRFAKADEEEALGASDLDLFARAAFLSGHDERCVDLLGRAYHSHVDGGDRPAAAESAFWAAFNLMNRGEMARAGGWLGRAQQIVDECNEAVAARGFVLVPGAVGAMMQGDGTTALGLFVQAEEAGRRCGNQDLVALAGLGIGQSRIILGDVGAGLAQLDEVMLSVAAGEVSALLAGLIYCAVIMACRETYEVRRATEWTRALDHWCAAQPDLVPFRGQCLVHRAQILQLTGAWTDAMAQVDLARRRLSDPPGQPAVGMAFYEQAELHRLRGDLAAAEDGYRSAGLCGHETQPGLALLRLVQGRVDSALAGLRRALEESPRGGRALLDAAQVDVAVAMGDLPQARRAAEELEELARERPVPLLSATSAHATGTVLLAEGDARGALEVLRRARDGWRDLDAPYFHARTRVLLGEACRQLGDVDAAQIEVDAAVEVFRRLRAAVDLAALEGAGAPSGRDPDGLTPREVQVLRSVATGRTNRAIAEELVLSEKTIARHLSNIFTKLGVSSRAAATAYAYEHGLVGGHAEN